MDSPEVTFTLAYLVFAVCFVFTPNEFHSAGLTVQNLLSGWLGSEDAAFVPYHLRRTAATLLCHLPLPLGYYVGMCFAAWDKRLHSPSQAPEAWRLFLLLAVALPSAACAVVCYWSRDRWARHPWPAPWRGTRSRARAGVPSPPPSTPSSGASTSSPPGRRARA